jgi:hypothetical protein
MRCSLITLSARSRVARWAWRGPGSVALAKPQLRAVAVGALGRLLAGLRDVAVGARRLVGGHGDAGADDARDRHVVRVEMPAVLQSLT